MSSFLKKYLWLVFPLIFSLVSIISFYHHSTEASDTKHDHGSCSLCIFAEGSSRVTLPENTSIISLILILAVISITLFYTNTYSQPAFGINKSRSPPLN